MNTDNNRIRLEIDKTIREINREIINPAIPKLSVKDIEPTMRLLARVRAMYLKEVLDIAQVVEDDLPSPDQVQQLQYLRETYEELVKGAKALDTAIERRYLDVTHNNG